VASLALEPDGEPAPARTGEEGEVLGDRLVVGEWDVVLGGHLLHGEGQRAGRDQAAEVEEIPDAAVAQEPRAQGMAGGEAVRTAKEDVFDALEGALLDLAQRLHLVARLLGARGRGGEPEQQQGGEAGPAHQGVPPAAVAGRPWPGPRMRSRYLA